MEQPIINTKNGAIRGCQLVSKSGKKYFSFQGIPYAKPPIENLRFKAPQPLEPWTGVRDALEEGPVCPQIDMITKSYVGEENCLFVNVYTPQLPGDNVSLPVMVWIHGGAFVSGSGNTDLYGPDYLIQQNVVVVTLNYRLGALGFLDTEDGEVSANCGMRDQVAALLWVKENITEFGGYPGNITVFGESAGSASSQLLLLSKMTQGLFAKSISESGNSINPWAIKTSPKETAFKLGDYLGLKTSNSKELVTFLQTIDAKTIVDAVAKLSDEAGFLKLLFTPTIEKEDYGEGVFLSGKPLDLIQRGKFHKIPQICGCNTSEGLISLGGVQEDPDYLNKIDKDLSLLVPDDILINGESKQKLGQQIKEFYFGESHINLDTKMNYVDYSTDINFSYGTNRALRIFSAYTTENIFYYTFSFDGALGFLKKRLGDLANGIPGPAHADELLYIFSSSLVPEVDDNSNEAKVRSIMVKLWTNFAKTGDPTPDKDPLIGVNWDAISADQQPYLNISTEPKMEAAYTPERLKFWDQLYGHQTH